VSPVPWLLVAAAVLAWPARPRATMRRIRASGTSRTRAGAEANDSGRPPSRQRRWMLAGAAGLAASLAVGGVPGLVAGAVVAGGAERLLRLQVPDADRELRAGLVRELPAACDLLAVCLSAGVPVGVALAAVGGVVPAPLGPQLSGIAGLYRLGAEPRRAWADAPEPLAGLGRVLVRAGESGASVAPGLRTLAADHRAEVRSATEAAVRRAGVWVLAPLGLCFLPAFVCLGVVPLVLGIAADVFG
jgi:hypothetical protein